MRFQMIVAFPALQANLGTGLQEWCLAGWWMFGIGNWVLGTVYRISVRLLGRVLIDSVL